jgi:uncharacterized protein (TIGR03545 family)
MTQWIRPWGVVILLVLILGTVLFANSLLKHFIITRGTELNGAKVELESLNLDLWPATLELRGFRVTDAQNPMVNLIDIGWIKLHLDGVMPIQKPLIIDRLELSQLQINSPRNDSGVLDKKSPNRRPEYDFTAVLPNLSMDDMVPMLRSVLLNSRFSLSSRAGKQILSSYRVKINLRNTRRVGSV